VSSTIVVTLAVIAAIGWLAFLAVSALRSRGPEEIPPNLAPGSTDDTIETTRLERAQQAAVLLSAVLAIGLPLYYLGEQNRQEGFVEQFGEESITRGEHLVEEYACYGCHGPEGVGGVASYVEKRTGVTVSWAAPPINDVFYRYGREEVRYWLTYGRQNTPMPAWGLAGGGPMNEQQIEDIINYLETVQISQPEAAGLVEGNIDQALRRLEGAEAAVETAIREQSQTIADLRRSPSLVEPVEALAARADDILAREGGIDTDGDGLADTVEEEISQLSAESFQVHLLPGLEPIELDPADPATGGTPDAETAAAALATLEGLVDSGQAPILAGNVEAIAAAIADEGEDGDGDGLSDAAEAQIVGQVSDAISKTVPAGVEPITLDPSNPESRGGVSDFDTAHRLAGTLASEALRLRIEANNQDTLVPPAVDALENLLSAAEDRKWEFDFQAIADHAFDGDVERAERVVGLFNGYCARCHTSGYSAGAPFTQEAGSGGFGPALWEARPAVQFLSDEALVQFLIVGAEADQPYGVNGMGNGQMPAFGTTLSEQDISDLAHWLRQGNLTGMGDD
jgi:mono/diheme cytochrome c family protein